MKQRQENRIVIIDEKKRLIDISNVNIKEDIQDNGRTLKLFIERRLLKK